MKLVVLGATGGVGREIIRQAIERRHAITAFARNLQRLAKFGDRILAIQGDPLNSAELQPIIAGQDAILAAFGPPIPVPPSDTHLMLRFASALIDAMLRVGTRRLILVSTAFLFRDAIIPPAYLVGRLFFSGIVTDAAAMEAIVRKSTSEWTIARPPRLTDKRRTGAYRAHKGRLPPLGFSISRADVADFMIGTVEQGSYIRKVVGISN